MVHSITRLLAAAALVALPLTAASAVSAKADTLVGPELMQFVNGKRVYLKTPFGGEFPLYYKTDGRVTGDGTALGLGRYFAPRETGNWFVDGNRLCQQFPTWYKGRMQCFRIQQTGDSTLRWIRDDGESGRARVEG